MDDRRALAALLLVLQAALAFLAALGLLVFARLSRALALMAVPEFVAFGGVVVLLLLAYGVYRQGRYSRLVAVAWQVTTLLGTAVAIVSSRGEDLALTLVLTGAVLPLAILMLLARRGSLHPDARRGLLVGLLVLTGLIHLALVPDHMSGPRPRLGPWFALDGIAFLTLAVLNWRSTRWRGPTTFLLLATIAAYLLVAARGLEPVDDLAVATKLIELAALALIVWPARPRVNLRLAGAVATLFLAIGVSGAVAWAASLRPSDSGTAHDGRVLLAAPPPSDEQRAAAATLVDETRADIARYQDLSVALADGYRASTATTAPTVHYVNPRYQRDGLTLDPEKPEALVYANTAHGPMLLGAMFIWPKGKSPPPDFGGSLAEWHVHTNGCFTVNAIIDGLASPYGTCPIGSVNVETPAMLHVWTVDNPSGPFGELTPAFIAQLTRT
jgi:hypothetical protein